jgi:hypothetical protein
MPARRRSRDDNHYRTAQSGNKQRTLVHTHQAKDLVMAKTALFVAQLDVYGV